MLVLLIHAVCKAVAQVFVPKVVALLIATQEIGFLFQISSQRPPVSMEDFLWSFSVSQNKCQESICVLDCGVIFTILHSVK